MSIATSHVVELTREELYERVWSTPMRILAPQFSLSDVGLAKICRKHDIPRPPRGYCAKKEFGKAPPQTPLPATDGRAGWSVTGRSVPVAFVPQQETLP